MALLVFTYNIFSVRQILTTLKELILNVIEAEVSKLRVNQSSQNKCFITNVSKEKMLRSSLAGI